jgi:SnoaL-like domain
MSVEQTQNAIARYFEIMGRSGDFAICYSPDVTWIASDTEGRIEGPDAVRDYIVALHHNMLDAKTRRLVVGDGNAYLEGDCADPVGATGSRIYYCVAYEMRHDLITGMRCYGPVARLTPESR